MPAPAESTWLFRVESGMERLLDVSHIAAPDELPGMVAAAAGGFDGEDAIICLADLQERILVPFQGPSSHIHDESPQALGVDSTVAGRAFQQMHQLFQSADARDGAHRTRIWLPLIDGTERLGVLGVTLPSSAVDDEPGMRRL